MEKIEITKDYKQIWARTNVKKKSLIKIPGENIM